MSEVTLVNGNEVSQEEIAAALEIPADFNFNLPDPEDEEIRESDFREQLDTIWKICDRFDLQTDIWRGRVLRSIRDREKKRRRRKRCGFY